MKVNDKVKILTQTPINGLYVYDMEGVIEQINDQKLTVEYKIYIPKACDRFYFWRDEFVLLEDDNSTIEKCVTNLWENKEMGEFSGLEFTNEVKKIMGTPNRYPDTIIRSMRKLRQDNKINYAIVDNKKSIYMKVAIDEPKEDLI